MQSRKGISHAGHVNLNKRIDGRIKQLHAFDGRDPETFYRKLKDHTLNIRPGPLEKEHPAA